jgi:pheromone shutdown protein TraB
MNAQHLFNRMLRSMSFSEKLKMFISGFAGFFVSKKRVEKEMDKLEGNLESYIKEVGDKFPTIKRVLIDERNQYMVQQLVTAGEKYERVIAVVGDGHIPGISELLKKKETEFETIRLSKLRSMPSSESSFASFSIEYKEV